MRLRRLAEEHRGRVRIQVRAFILRPRDEPGGTFTSYHLQHRAAAAQRSGLPYDLPAVGHRYPCSSLPALEAAKWVEHEHPHRFDAFDQALFEAFFQHTEDIGDAEVLRSLVTRVGVDGADLVDALRSGRHRQEVLRDHADALQRGIHAVPTVLIGPHSISGAVPYEQYRDALQDVMGSTRPQDAPRSGS